MKVSHRSRVIFKAILLSWAVLAIVTFTFDQVWTGFSSWHTGYIGFIFMLVANFDILGMRKAVLRRIALTTGALIIAISFVHAMIFPTDTVESLIEILLLGFATYCIMSEYSIIIKVVD